MAAVVVVENNGNEIVPGNSHLNRNYSRDCCRLHQWHEKKKAKFYIAIAPLYAYAVHIVASILILYLFPICVSSFYYFWFVSLFCIFQHPDFHCCTFKFAATAY